MFNFIKVKMKKVCLLSALFLMAVTMFTSCLDSGSDEQSGPTAGVVRFDSNTMKYVIDTDRFGTVYSPVFNSSELDITEGKCYYLHITVNFDDPENSSEQLAINKYYTGIVNSKYEVSKYSISPGFMDTAQVVANEVPVVNGLNYIYGLVNGIFFLEHVVKKPEDQNLSWYLTYNTDSMVTVESSDRIYDIFLRAVKNNEGTKTSLESAVLNAYDMKYYMESAAKKEKELGKSVVNIRFNYVSDIKDEKMTWKKTDKTSIDVSWFLEND